MRNPDGYSPDFLFLLQISYKSHPPQGLQSFRLFLVRTIRTVMKMVSAITVINIVQLAKFIG